MSSRVAVITGAGRGLGEAISREIAAADVSVVLAGRALDPLESTRQRIESAGGVALVQQTDVTDPQSVTELFDAADSAFGRVDVLVNNAGITGQVNLVDLDDSEWDRIFDTNVRGMFLCSREAGRRFAKAGVGACDQRRFSVRIAGPTRVLCLLRFEGRGHQLHPVRRG